MDGPVVSVPLVSDSDGSAGRPRALGARPTPAPTAWRGGSPPARRPSTTPSGRWSATSPRVHLQRAPAEPGVPARGVPVRGQDRLLPAVLGRDGADAAGCPAYPRAWCRASRPARSTATPASTGCATSTPTPGSRSSSTSIGWVTFDPTPPAAPADRAGQGLSGPLGATARSRAPRTPGARRRTRIRRRPARRAAAGAATRPAAGRRGRDRDPDRPGGRGARRRPVVVAATAAREPRPRGRSARAASARCRGSAGRCPPARRCWSWSAGLAGWPGPAPPDTWRGCARAAIRRAGAAAARPRRPAGRCGAS